MDPVLLSPVLFESCCSFVGSLGKESQLSSGEKVILEVISGVSLAGVGEVTADTKMCMHFHPLASLDSCDNECADK